MLFRHSATRAGKLHLPMELIGVERDVSGGHDLLRSDPGPVDMIGRSLAVAKKASMSGINTPRQTRPIAPRPFSVCCVPAHHATT